MDAGDRRGGGVVWNERGGVLGGGGGGGGRVPGLGGGGEEGRGRVWSSHLDPRGDTRYTFIYFCMARQTFKQPYLTMATKKTAFVYKHTHAQKHTHKL